ncbi:IMPACT family member YigZ [bioreactor metagenome]|uniref:IMPACT family member YigZ n=1 Tax=bioreactor metagenome TaxID=1076179 RepID=A0A645E328_9ZZZZ
MESEEGALELLEHTRKRYYDARHNCFAYSIGRLGETARFSDDGEPGGTAGAPMMEAIRHSGVTDLIVIATRYFGGILLGTGGLVRAYSKTAQDAIAAAKPVDMVACVRCALTIEYPLWGRVESALHAFGCAIENVVYTDMVHTELFVKSGEEAALRQKLLDAANGRLELETYETAYRKWII